MKTSENRWEPSRTDGFRRMSSKAGEFVGLRRLPAVGAVPGEHGRRYGRRTLNPVGFRSMPPAPGDFSKSEHITAYADHRGRPLGPN